MITSKQRERLIAILERQPTNLPTPRLTPTEIQELRTLVEEGRDDDAWVELCFKFNSAIGNSFDTLLEKGLALTKQRMDDKEHAARIAAIKIMEVVKQPASEQSANPQGKNFNRNLLDPAIDKAIDQAKSMEFADVYLQLKSLALDEEKPFTGIVLKEGALEYTDDDNNKPFTKNALQKRLKKRRSPPTTA
jgi:hypothetical protein